MTMTTFSHESAMEPDWDSRPWSRPVLRQAFNDSSPNLVAVCEFNYQGLKIRGVRLYRTERGLVVNMPQKKFGDAIENTVYFLDREERERFTRDITWVFDNGLGRRLRSA